MTQTNAKPKIKSLFKALQLFSRCPHHQTEPTCFVFSTSLSSSDDVLKITPKLNAISSIESWSVDLEDWEHVLCVNCTEMKADDVIELIQSEGFDCTEMPI